MKSRIKKIKIEKNKSKQKSLLFSSISNLNDKENKRTLNLIHLSNLCRYKLNINQETTNTNINTNKKTIQKYNSLGKIYHNSSSQYDNSNTNLLSDCTSIVTQKKSLLKLPKIKSYRGNNNESSLINSILSKFREYDYKFKEQEKVSEFIIKRGDKFSKLKKEYIKNYDKFKISPSKRNYKIKYSKLFRRIKNIQVS